MKNASFELEICANGYTSVEAAYLGGAHRVELCDNLAEGGTTPSYGMVKQCLTDFKIDLFPIIRPRGGNFVYSNSEIQIMCSDIEAFKKLGCKGVVIGCLDKERNIDESTVKELISAASTMQVSFHRAIDRSNNLLHSLDILKKLGIKRVLTSGGQAQAINGLDMLKQLVFASENEIEIMPGSGVNLDNIVRIWQYTGARSFHTTAKTTYVNTAQNNTDLTENLEYTDKSKVRQLLELLSTLP